MNSPNMLNSPSGRHTLTSHQSPPLLCQGRSLIKSVSLTTTTSRWEPVNTCPALTIPPVSRPIRKRAAHTANQTRGMFNRVCPHQSENRRKKGPPPWGTHTHHTCSPRPHTDRPRPQSTGRPTERRTGGKPVSLIPHHPSGLQTPTRVQTLVFGPPQT